jgi:hypothetical protein
MDPSPSGNPSSFAIEEEGHVGSHEVVDILEGITDHNDLTIAFSIDQFGQKLITMGDQILGLINHKNV